MLKDKKLLILGSDYATVDIVKEAHKMGIYVIVSDLMETSPTKKLADEVWLISTTDTNTLERKCKEVGVNGVITGASDFNIRQSRILCKRLGFPVYCASDKAWEISTNKRAFKDLCKNVGAPIATDYSLTEEFRPEDLASIKYPVVVKPVDMSGNRGMSYCANEQELKEAYRLARSVSKNSTIIVERELKGPEYAVNYLLADGKIQLEFLGSEHNEPGELDNLYSVINTTSCHLKQYLDEVNDKVIEVFSKAGCRDGVAWVECIRDQDGHFYLLEMGYRFGGEAVNVPYEYVNGFNAIRFMIEFAMGIKHTVESLPAPLTTAKRKCAAAYMLFAKRDDVIKEISGIDYVTSLPNVTLDMPKRVGNPVRFHATMGVVHIAANDIDELCDTIKKINCHLKISGEKGDGLFIYYTDFKTLKEEYEDGLREFDL